ncbi:hypothetical protein J4E85_008962 [Alternaria conjuncta]|uniref:uncharacterized protein n=1 Tax=Alternaria conjuncta TaxID=181017 RepID=UPI00221FB8CD|nr:uncharacterized protein J4E85_008962 [Alternaria conjuncta]KAI4920847.1 hypothetical protein J4E85_008962 [Alternaria conjuncta]
MASFTSHNATIVEPMQATSHPANPSKPSFLELPAEIRNAVYELLFKNDGPVFLHNADAFLPRAPDLDDYDDVELRSCRCETCRYEGISHYERDRQAWAAAMDNDAKDLQFLKAEFADGLSDGLGILRSCRQICSEAGGVLYGHNTFAFTRRTDRHDISYLTNAYRAWYEPMFYTNERYNQLNYSARWMSSIGDHYRFLRKVVIDTDAMCPSHCRWAADFDVLPLLRIMWAHPEAKCEIVFESTGRALSAHIHGTSDPTAVPEDLNTLLHTLGKEDMLGLRRVSRSLKSVVIEFKRVGRSRSEWHFVKYKRSGLRFFTVLSKGAEVSWNPKKPIKSRADLPRSIRQIIARYAALGPEGIVVDLTAHVTHGLDLTLLSLVPCSVKSLIRPGYSLTLSMTSQEAETSFKRFSALDALLWPEAINNTTISYIARGEFGLTSGQSIDLNFIVDDDKGLEDVKINMRGFVRFLSSMSILKANMWSTIKIIIKDNEGHQRACSQMPLEKLRQAVFLFFTDLLRDSIYARERQHYTPNIRINGFGAILKCIEKPHEFRCTRATKWKSDVSSNAVPGFSGGQKLKLASVADVIRRRAELMDFACPVDRRDECLIHAWDDLRRCVEVGWGSLDDALKKMRR